MGKFSTSKHGSAQREPLLIQEAAQSSNGPFSDLEHGDSIPAANVGPCRVLSLAKPESAKLALATIFLLISSTTSILIPRFGGRIIDIVSGDIKTPAQQDEALAAVN